MESQKMHLRHVVLHCFKKGNSAKDAADEIFTVYGSGTTTIRTVGNWFKKFRAGNFELKAEDRSGRPATTHTDIIKTVLTGNPRYSVREIVDATNIPKTTVHKHRYEVWVPHLLTETGLMNRVSTIDTWIDILDVSTWILMLDRYIRYRYRHLDSTRQTLGDYSHRARYMENWRKMPQDLGVRGSDELLSQSGAVSNGAAMSPQPHHAADNNNDAKKKKYKKILGIKTPLFRKILKDLENGTCNMKLMISKKRISVPRIMPIDCLVDDDVRRTWEKADVRICEDVLNGQWNHTLNVINDFLGRELNLNEIFPSDFLLTGINFYFRSLKMVRKIDPAGHNGGRVKLDKSHNGKLSRVIHIRNIPNEVSEGEIIHLGVPFGRVTNVLVLKGKNQTRKFSKFCKFSEFTENLLYLENLNCVDEVISVVRYFNSILPSPFHPDLEILPTLMSFLVSVQLKLLISVHWCLAFLEMADENAAATMVNYYASCMAQLRGRAVYVQFSNHRELKTDQTHTNNAVSFYIIFEAEQIVCGRELILLFDDTSIDTDSLKPALKKKTHSRYSEFKFLENEKQQKKLDSRFNPLARSIVLAPHYIPQILFETRQTRSPFAVNFNFHSTTSIPEITSDYAAPITYFNPVLPASNRQNQDLIRLNFIK
ncbi:Histone-lysine N-methyltransferase SETMAR [Melipona quadrifasciata]|uniref:Histone-lysine N-methyltransferase SETMAR n=1 Tax=Melipona quadrifasciata TaxID=166423 RepID=A0A0M8ZNY4_9HYME|nr:Histone-lysine N-methyltransferase SETMAR [Melipona quadrifasciata]